MLFRARLDMPGRLKWHAVSVGCLGTTIDAIVLPLGILEYRLVLNATPLVIPSHLLLVAPFISKHTKRGVTAQSSDEPPGCHSAGNCPGRCSP